MENLLVIVEDKANLIDILSKIVNAKRENFKLYATNWNVKEEKYEDLTYVLNDYGSKIELKITCARNEQPVDIKEVKYPDYCYNEKRIANKKKDWISRIDLDQVKQMLDVNT
jgi:hypothetical protein